MVICSVLIPCRDGEEHLEATLQSLLAQTVSIDITVIDDHSIDKTEEILKKYPQVNTIRLKVREPKGYDRIGRIMNQGLNIAAKAPFYMISGDDTKFPPDYIERIIRLMKVEGISISSGHARGYKDTDAPDGSGRIFTAQAWESMTPFSENISWESGPLHKARFLGLKIKKFPVKKWHLRPYSNTSLRTFGHSSYTLGNPLLWTVTRVILEIIKRNKTPRMAMNILVGHIEFMIKRKPKEEMASLVYKVRMRRISREFISLVIYRLIIKPLERLGLWRKK